jgi:hypothetical protein
MLDEHTTEALQLTNHSLLSVGVLGNGEDFILVRLDDEGDPQDSHDFYAAMEVAEERGFLYCGVIAYKDGKTGARYAPGITDNAEVALPMFLAARAFERLLAEHLQPQPAVTTEWLTQLFQLPDTRH